LRPRGLDAAIREPVRPDGERVTVVAVVTMRLGPPTMCGRVVKRTCSAYAHAMRDESELDLRLTRLLAVDASLTDARRALLRAARIPSAFSSEVRALLAVVADLDRRVGLEVTG
jgi:hypothetical protein